MFRSLAQIKDLSNEDLFRRIYYNTSTTLNWLLVLGFGRINMQKNAFMNVSKEKSSLNTEKVAI